MAIKTLNQTIDKLSAEKTALNTSIDQLQKDKDLLQKKISTIK